MIKNNKVFNLLLIDNVSNEKLIQKLYLLKM